MTMKTIKKKESNKETKAVDIDLKGKKIIILMSAYMNDVFRAGIHQYEISTITGHFPALYI